MSSDVNAHFALNTYSYTLHGTIAEHLPGFAAAGFRELELMMYPGHLWPPAMDAAARVALRRDLEAHGLTVRTLNQPNIDINVTAASPEMPFHHSAKKTQSPFCSNVPDATCASASDRIASSLKEDFVSSFGRKATLSRMDRLRSWWCR